MAPDHGHFETNSPLTSYAKITSYRICKESVIIYWLPATRIMQARSAKGDKSVHIYVIFHKSLQKKGRESLCKINGVDVH